MKQCYIKLNILRHVDGDVCSDQAQKPLPDQKQRHVKVSQEGARIELQELFDPRKDSDNEEPLKPRRVYIHGRPGVGKTTLCKKAVYDFLYKVTWKELCDRILWIPLRDLMSHDNEYSLAKLFRDEFSRNAVEEAKTVLTKVLSGECEQGGKRTLFILGGLDEVWHELSYPSNKCSCVLKLLNMPNVIVTSRPSVSLPTEAEPFPLRLETVGFDQTQVEAYVDAIESENAVDIKTFLGSDILNQDLCQIPIQLDALCCVWEEVNQNEMQTATQLAINKGNHRLKETIRLLEEIAFNGILHDAIYFEFRHLRNFLLGGPQEIEQVRMGTPRVSLVRVSDIVHQGQHEGSFHFLHLTFQEFFAARFIERQWGSQKAHEIIEQYKYAARFNMVWRFVAGLLSENGKAEDFFSAINNEPRDLIGPTHQRLIMRSLTEVSESTPHRPKQTDRLRKKIEKDLIKWVFETRHPSVIGIPEFPSQCLTEIALLEIRQRERIRKMVGKTAWKTRAKFEALENLRKRSNLYEPTLQAIAECLRDQDQDVRRAALEALGAQTNLSESIVQAIAGCLRDEG